MAQSCGVVIPAAVVGRPTARTKSKLHLEMATDENIARGMSPDEARHAALRSFGGIVKTREAYRETAGFPSLDALWQDVRYAVRAYRRTPGFAVVVVVTLALAIGANSAIFSLLNALMLRDLPVRDPDTLVQISTVTPGQGESYLTFSMFRELSAQQKVFTSVIGTSGNTGVTVNGNGTIMRGLLWAATGNVYEELGVRPVVGRLLAAGDMTVDPPGADAVAVLGYGFWQRHYGGDVSVVGRTIQVEGISFTVVGVAPAGFTGFALVMEPDITIPLAATPLVSGRSPSTLTTSASRSVRVIGRLKTGATIEQARAQLTAVWPAVREAALPPAYTGPRRDDFLSIGLDVDLCIQRKRELAEDAIRPTAHHPPGYREPRAAHRVHECCESAVITGERQASRDWGTSGPRCEQMARGTAARHRRRAAVARGCGLRRHALFLGVRRNHAVSCSRNICIQSCSTADPI